MVLKKKCIKISHQKIYREGEEGFDEEYCIRCGAPLMEYNEVEEFDKEEYIAANKIDTTQEDNENEEKVYYLTESNNIRFYEIHGAPIQLQEVEDIIEGPRVLVYKKDKIVEIVPIIYDEILIGRKSLNVEPEIDLSFIDEERYTSRKHALIYIKDQEFYIKRLSVKNSLHVNLTSVLEKDIKLSNGDMIVLSRKFALEFRM